MPYFPMCLDLTGKTVLLIGSGPQTDDKAEKLQSFGCCLCRRDILTDRDLTPPPAFVVIGDTSQALARQYAALCTRRNIPVNVVDQPGLCSFTFPALITQGDLSVAISTGGKSPAAAVWLKERICAVIPTATAHILTWLGSLRSTGMDRTALKQAARQALEQNRIPLQH